MKTQHKHNTAQNITRYTFYGTHIIPNDRINHILGLKRKKEETQAVSVGLKFKEPVLPSGDGDAALEDGPPSGATQPAQPRHTGTAEGVHGQVTRQNLSMHLDL